MQRHTCRERAGEADILAQIWHKCGTRGAAFESWILSPSDQHMISSQSLHRAAADALAPRRSRRRFPRAPLRFPSPQTPLTACAACTLDISRTERVLSPSEYAYATPRPLSQPSSSRGPTGSVAPAATSGHRVDVRTRKPPAPAVNVRRTRFLAYLTAAPPHTLDHARSDTSCQRVSRQPDGHKPRWFPPRADGAARCCCATLIPAHSFTSYR